VSAIYDVIKLLYVKGSADDFPWKRNTTNKVWHKRRNPNNINELEILK
jgi:hypothetical protein